MVLEAPSCDFIAIFNMQVGDRYFTDVVYGNNNGLLTVRPAPLTLIGEPFVVQKVLYLSFSYVFAYHFNDFLIIDHP